MSAAPPVRPEMKAPSPEKTLRRLFLTVFVRGQSARGITKQTVAKSFTQKMGMMFLIYGLFGLSSLALIRQSVLLISVSLHSLTFLALGMFISASAGEALFNKEESEILMHRPVTSQMLLRAKSAVLLQIGFSVALALNAIGFFVGMTANDGGILFPLVHLVSTAEEALFSIGAVVLMYQLCLKWLGRERLEGIMTTMQVLLIISITMGSQILPRAIGHGNLGKVSLDAWWFKVLPPAWFASLDDAVAGSHSQSSWMLAGVGVLVTGVILWLGFTKLAAVYEAGMQTLNEAAKPSANQTRRYRTLKVLSESAPLSWFLRTPVSKAGFQLVSAYMFRDRDTKLRLYPGVAPMMIMPIMLLIGNQGISKGPMDSTVSDSLGGFFSAMSATYVCLVPLSALNLLKFSQQYRASDVFIAAPLPGPAPLMQGARVAVVFFLTLPMMVALSIFFVATRGISSLGMVLSGLFALPIYAMIPGAFENAAPLSNPIEEAKSLNNMPVMMLSIFGSIGVAGGATLFASLGLLPVFWVIEAIVSAIACVLMHRLTLKRGWRTYD